MMLAVRRDAIPDLLVNADNNLQETASNASKQMKLQKTGSERYLMLPENNQTAIVPATKPGNYYIMVRGFDEPQANAPARLLVDVVPLAITSVSPDQGGDNRWVTLNIEGAKFSPDALVKLVRPGVAEFEPVDYEVLDSTHIKAIFDLTGAPPGLYDLRVVNPDGNVATEAYRYLVERALERDVTIGLGGPRVIPAGGLGTYGISLQSLTNVDTPYVRLE